MIAGHGDRQEGELVLVGQNPAEDDTDFARNDHPEERRRLQGGQQEHQQQRQQRRQMQNSFEMWPRVRCYPFLRPDSRVATVGPQRAT